ncbi:MAG: hypothetical protein OQL08_00865 [Gammaproteobacteria bacterium]|nr:hypothetical protein [Gammaproteobacteria bacterium]
MPVRWLLLLALFNVTIVAAEEDAPPLALLEYLGEWLDEGGNEIDPQELALLQLDGEPVGGEGNDKE